MAIDIPATAAALTDVRSKLDAFSKSLDQLRSVAGPDIASLIDVDGAFEQVVPVIERMEALFDAAGGAGNSGPSMRTEPPAPEPRSQPRPRKRGRVKLTEAKMRAALDATGGIKTKAAAKLGVTPVTFRKYELQFGISGPKADAAPKEDAAPKPKTYLLRKRTPAEDAPATQPET